MKRMLALLALLALMATGANANENGGDSFIGIYADDLYTTCNVAIPVYITTQVFLFAYMDAEVGIDSGTAFEFMVENLPEAGADGILTPVWTTDLVIGPVDVGISLAYNPALEGPWGLLGTIDFFMMNAAWIGDDHDIRILHSDTSGNRVIVNGDFVTFDVGGRVFWFNCTGDCPCGIDAPVEPASWGSIKSLY